jgi:GNAT superfamily N-acetyltransferase
MIIRHCTVAEILQAPNIERITEEYAAESAIKGLPHPIAKMEMYYALETAGALYVIGAFVDGRPIGFISVLSTIMPHYSVCLSVSESFFVLKCARGSGAGLKLLRAAEARAREVGSPGLLVSAPHGGALAEVLPHVGYRPSNAVFFKGFADA